MILAGVSAPYLAAYRGDEPLLRAYDTISPLPSPMYNAGPFMVYRHSPQVDSLYRRSTQWRR